MKLLSTDDYEAGVIAIGGRPIGIIAIGAMPIGIISLGFASTGVLALSVGASAGIVTISCGLGVGFFGGGAGLTLALKGATIGSDISVLDRDEHIEEIYKKTRFDDLADDAIDAAALRGDTKEGWVVVAPMRWQGAYRLEVDGHVLELDDAVREKLGTPPDGELPRVIAHVRAVPSPDGASGGSYREPARQRLTLRCDNVEIEAREVERVTTSRFNYFGLLWKLPLWLAAMTFVASSVYTAIDDLDLDRRATVTWKGRVTESANAKNIPVGAECELSGRLRTDGRTRQKAAVTLRCAGVRVYRDDSDAPATIHRRVSKGGTSAFSLAYGNAGRRPDHSGDDDDDGKPSISVDTEARKVISAHTYPAPWRIVIEVEAWSERAVMKVEGPALVATTSSPTPE